MTISSIKNVVQFLRKRDYKFIKILGRGGFGETVLLQDDIIDDFFVCKKYSPQQEIYKQALFSTFITEIKLLHQIHHRNIVRAFSYYLYPDKHTGYILMEYIKGTDISSYIKEHPEDANNVFDQVVDGFTYLESINILHRDIRPQNIMINECGITKIIDLGFGKKAECSIDFDKSISLNWWCTPPLEFSKNTYNFATEVYFVGKLFEKIVQENNLEQFKYFSLLQRMCHIDPAERIQKFSDIQRHITTQTSSDFEFTDDELDIYRSFADEFSFNITKIESGVKYKTDTEEIIQKLESVYKNCMLEQYIPDNAPLNRCFMEGTWYYKKSGFHISILRNFLSLFRIASIEKRKIILANLHTRLDAINRYTNKKTSFDDMDDDIPF